MNIFKSLTILLFLTLPFGAQAQEDECHIDAEIWFSTGYSEQDQYLCTFNWAVADIQYLPAGEFNASGTCMVLVDLIDKGDPRLETLVMREDGNAQIWYAGQWSGMVDFEPMVLGGGCALPPTS